MPVSLAPWHDPPLPSGSTKRMIAPVSTVSYASPILPLFAMESHSLCWFAQSKHPVFIILLLKIPSLNSPTGIWIPALLSLLKSLFSAPLLPMIFVLLLFLLLAISLASFQPFMPLLTPSLILTKPAPLTPCSLPFGSPSIRFLSTL